jgi:hypothetical protein
MPIQDGSKNPVKFTPAGGSEITCKIEAWDCDDEVLTHIVTHSASAQDANNRVLQERIASIRDAKGNVTLSFNYADVANYAVTKIAPGVTGLIKNYVTPTSFHSLGMVIKKIHWRSAVQEVVKVNFDWELESSSGGITLAT